MIVVRKGIAEVRPFFHGPEREFLRVLLNSDSPAEANLALGLLRESVPEKNLVTAVNLREALKDLPACPFPMAVEIDTLARVAHLTKEKGAWVRSFADSGGDFDLLVVSEGNLCFDIVVRLGDRNVFWTPLPRDGEIIHPELVEPLIDHETLLGQVVELVKDMGMPFSPTFYLSLDDWLLEYAEDSMDDLGKLF